MLKVVKKKLGIQQNKHIEDLSSSMLTQVENSTESSLSFAVLKMLKKQSTSRKPQSRDWPTAGATKLQSLVTVAHYHCFATHLMFATHPLTSCLPLTCCSPLNARRSHLFFRINSKQDNAYSLVENMNNSNRAHYKYSTPNHQKISIFLLCQGRMTQQKGTDLWEKHKTRLPFSRSPFWRPFNQYPVFKMAVLLKIPQVFLASEVHKRPNAPVPGKKLVTKVNKSRDMPRPICPRGQPLGWPLISPLFIFRGLNIIPGSHKVTHSRSHSRIKLNLA